MSYETFLTGQAGGVARITLDRPEVRNALSRTMLAELEAALAAARRSVRAPTSRAWATAAPR